MTDSMKSKVVKLTKKERDVILRIARKTKIDVWFFLQQIIPTKDDTDFSSVTPNNEYFAVWDIENERYLGWIEAMVPLLESLEVHNGEFLTREERQTLYGIMAWTLSGTMPNFK